MDLLFQFLKNEHNPFNKIQKLIHYNKSKEIDKITDKWNNIYGEIKKNIVNCSTLNKLEYREIEEKLDNFKLLINFLIYGELMEHIYVQITNKLNELNNESEKHLKHLKRLKENDNICKLM